MTLEIINLIFVPFATLNHRKMKHLFFIVVCALIFASCQDDSDDVTKIPSRCPGSMLLGCDGNHNDVIGYQYNDSFFTCYPLFDYTNIEPTMDEPCMRFDRLEGVPEIWSIDSIAIIGEKNEFVDVPSSASYSFVVPNKGSSAIFVSPESTHENGEYVGKFVYGEAKGLESTLIEINVADWFKLVRQGDNVFLYLKRSSDDICRLFAVWMSYEGREFSICQWKHPHDVYGW